MGGGNIVVWQRANDSRGETTAEDSSHSAFTMFEFLLVGRILCGVIQFLGGKGGIRRYHGHDGLDEFD